MSKPLPQFAIKTKEGYFAYQGTTCWFGTEVAGWVVTSSDTGWLESIAGQFKVENFELVLIED